MITILVSMTILTLLEFASSIKRCIRRFTKVKRRNGSTYRGFHRGEEIDLEDGELWVSWAYMLPEKEGDIVRSYSFSGCRC